MYIQQGNYWVFFVENKLNILKNSETLPGGAIVVNSKTGMIETPSQSIYGIEVRTLLNPQIKPGTLLQLNERDIQKALFSTTIEGQKTNQLLNPDAGPTMVVRGDGTYKVLLVASFGDTRGVEWYSDVICAALGQGMPLGIVSRGPSVSNNE